VEVEYAIKERKKYSSVTLNAIMSSFGMDACMEKFETLIKFMTSMN